MALDKNQLRTDLRVLFDETANDQSDLETAKTAFINKLSDIIDSYVKSAKVNYTSGLNAPNGPVTGTFNHTIS